MNVVFDLDGTLFQTACCTVNAMNRLCDELKLNRINEDEIVSNIGKNSDEFLKSLFPQDVDYCNYYEHFRFLEQEEVRKRGKLFYDIDKILNELKSLGHTLCICSSGSKEYINLVLSVTGISNYFDNIISSKNYVSKSEALKKLTDGDSNLVMVGDTLSDIIAADDNNIPSIGAKYGYGKEEDILKATYVADNANDIVTFVNLCDVFYKITSSIMHKTVKVVGINGVDTSGKTMFTNNYSKFLNSLNIKNTVLHIDDFHNPSEIRSIGENEIDAYYKNAFNYELLIDEILQPLKENNYINKDVLCLNLDTNKYEKNIHYDVDNETLLLVEGVLLFRQPLIDYFDMKIFLHIDFDEVLNRAKVRDVPKYGEGFLQKYINKYIPTQKKYLIEYQPEVIADIVINNEDYRNPHIEIK